MDKLVREGPAPAPGVVRGHAFPALSVPEERIVGDADGKGPFERIRFGADGRRQTHGKQGPASAESVAAQLRSAAKKAYDDGFADGKSAGAKEARKALESAMQQFRYACNALEQFKKELYLNAETATVELAMAIARKVVHAEVRCHPDIVVAVTREALTRIVDQERIRIHVNPEDLPVVTQALVDELAGQAKSADAVAVEPDGAVLPGGCRVVTNFGEIDAGIDTQLDAIEARLEAEFAKARVRR